ncbi:hypothetical protein ABJI51_14695 [Amycolatopsis sp. NEAU-NG30]|uniref:ApeA N-terminal domain-containing protein n=1 Tax=Amycolatopsis melonis TaxID=3156488 RepID=A0ABV0LEI6_9PSEU
MSDQFAKYVDPFGSTSEHSIGRTRIIRIGSIDVSSAVVESSFSNALNDRPKATIVLRAEHPTVPYIDWRAPVSAFMVQNGEQRPLFGGDIVSLSLKDSTLILECSGAAYFSEVRTGAYSCTKNAGIDLIYATARDGGTPSEMIKIDMGSATFEVFEIVIPVLGMSRLEVPYRQGNVLLTSSRDVLNRISQFEHRPLVEDFSKAEVFAIAYRSGLRMHDVEKIALADISATLDWLAIRSQYSLAVLPDGSTPAWSRKIGSARLSTRPLAYVRGLLSDRRWLRDTSTQRDIAPLELDDESLMLRNPGDLVELSQRVRLALSAYQRAVHEVDPASQVTQIWEVIEFYAGKTEVPVRFSKDDLKQIKRSLPKDLNVDQKARIGDLIGMLNSVPLLARLRVQIASDGIPITEEEFGTLARLRALRNDLVHGRVGSAGPASSEIGRGLGLVARIITYWVARENQEYRGRSWLLKPWLTRSAIDG